MPPTTRALLLTDIVDSTTLAEALGDRRMAQVWAIHDRVARDLLVLHRGREIDKSDGFLLLFEHTADAAAYALAYHRALAALDPPLHARVGLHVGEVILTANAPADVARGAKPLEVDGVAKPTAARIMALAVGGQTLLSDAARAELSERRHAWELRSHGHYRLKGVAEPIALFELGVRGESPFMPPPDTAQAYRVVQVEGSWRPVREIPHSLPAELDAFVGRRDDLLQLATRLDAGQRLVTVVGMGGTGKTRFVRRYGWTWLGDWPGGVFFCDLSEARSTSGIASAVAAALDVSLGNADPIDAVGDAIAGRGKCLILLDNFEQVTAHAAATVRPWMERAGEASFVVTSREILAVPGEHVLSLEPLPADGAGVELFVVRARARRAGFALTASNEKFVRDIVSLLDGLPLAIELAAARTAVLSPEQLLARLQDRFQILAGARGVPERQATLRAAIDWSWTLLAPWEQVALAQASVFVGGFTLEAAEHVLDVSAWPDAPPVMDVVQALVDKSLFRTWTARAGTRLAIEEPHFGMYVSIHEYAAEKLRTGGSLEAGADGANRERAASERHGRYFARFGAQDALTALDGPGGVARTQAHVLEFENLVAACRRAVGRRDTETAADAYAAVSVVTTLRGPYVLAAELGRQVLQLGALAASARRRVLASLADALREAGHMDEASRCYEGALAIARETDDRRAECRLLNKLGGMHWHDGRLEDASRCYEAALATYREMGDRFNEGITLGNLGLVRADQGRPEEARERYEAALAIDREVGNRRFEGIVLGNLGYLHFDQRRLDEALRDLQGARAIHREVGNRAMEGNVLGNLGCVYEAQGRLDEALNHYQEALAIHREIGGRRNEGMVLGSIGSLYAVQGRFAEAREVLTAGERVLRAVNNQWHLSLLFCSRGECERLAGDMGRARQYLADAALLAHGLAAGPDSQLLQEVEKLRVKLDSADGPPG